MLKRSRTWATVGGRNGRQLPTTTTTTSIITTTTTTIIRTTITTIYVTIYILEKWPMSLANLNPEHQKDKADTDFENMFWATVGRGFAYALGEKK